VAKAALAGSRLGDYADDLRVSRNRPLERRLESSHLALTADELREAARVGNVQARPHSPHALELVDMNRVTYPFDLERSEIAELEEPSHQLRSMLRQVRAPRRSKLLHPCCQAHGLPLRGVIHSKIVADSSHDDFSRVGSHSDQEAQSSRSLELLGIAPELISEV